MKKWTDRQRLDRQNIQNYSRKTYLCTYATYLRTLADWPVIQARVIIILHYLSYIYNKYLPNVQLFLTFSSKLSVRLANITLGKLKPKYYWPHFTISIGLLFVLNNFRNRRSLTTATVLWPDDKLPNRRVKQVYISFWLVLKWLLLTQY